MFKYSQLSTVQFWLCCSCFRAVLRILYLDPDPEICHTQNIINFFNIFKKFTKIITYEEKISKGKQCLFVHQSFFSTFSCMDPDLYLFGIRRSSRKLIQLGSRSTILVYGYIECKSLLQVPFNSPFLTPPHSTVNAKNWQTFSVKQFIH